MPWFCPACHTQIRHHPGDDQRPHKGQQYRCHVCRLELVFDEQTDHLTIAPFEQDHVVAEADASPARRIPLPANLPPKRKKQPRK